MVAGPPAGTACYLGCVGGITQALMRSTSGRSGYRFDLQIAIAVVVTACLLVGESVRADDYEAMIKHGVELRRNSQDREALAEFQRALAIKETPRVIAQIGLAEDALGLWLAAEEHLTAALKNESDSWIARNRAILQEALGSVADRLGSVEVWGEPPGAEVTIDGKAVGRLPLKPAARVTSGTCTLLVKADGYETLTRGMVVKAGVLNREHVQLVPSSLRLNATSGEGSAVGAEGTGHALVSQSVSQDGGETPTSVTRKWWFWTAIGGVVVGGVIGLLLVTRSKGGVDCPQGVECPR